MVSPDDVAREEGERLLEKMNIKKISDRQTFIVEYMRAYNTERGQHLLDNTSKNFLNLFWNNKEVQDKLKKKVSGLELKRNITSDDYGIFLDGIKKLLEKDKIKRKDDIEQAKIIAIKQINQTRNIKVKKYNRRGESIKGYNRSYTAWNKSQEAFLKVRPDMPLKKLFGEYNNIFKEKPRSIYSLRDKRARLLGKKK